MAYSSFILACLIYVDVIQTWQDALESMAQQWADKCLWKHGQVEVSQPPYPWIGQNLYTGTSM